MGLTVKEGKLQDERMPLLKEWLANPLMRAPGLDDRAHRNLVRAATHSSLAKKEGCTDGVWTADINW